ncbi:MAG: hypothetical protein ABIS50_11230 [Luteolibacter sp.]|uniref:hypothetical protein n=1 Tax=Luteolibacter sp. TaxID=1962973 RepID=UPI0032656B69
MKNSINPPFRLLAISILASCIGSPLLHAIPVRVLAWDSEIAGMKLALADSKGSKIIDAMHPAKRTGVYQISAGETPAVIETLDKKDAEGKPFKAAITIPDGLKQPLIVILPDSKAASGIRPFVIEDDSSSFAWGSNRFINATGKELVFVCEKKIVDLPPSWTPVIADAGGINRNLEVKLFFRDQPQRAIYSAVWEHNSDQRMLVFLVPGDDPRLGPVAMKMIPEDRRSKAPDEAASHNP